MANLAQHHSPRPTKTRASVINQFGDIVEDDESTIPIGNKWLQSKVATKAFQPRHSSFISTSFDPAIQYHASHIVAEAEGGVPQTVFDHIVWALQHESFEPQIVKLAILTQATSLAKTLTSASLPLRISESYRRIWLLYELWTETELNIPDVPEYIEPALLLDPEIYVTGPCWDLNSRCRYHPLFLSILTL
jgi:hypothetical protein